MNQDSRETRGWQRAVVGMHWTRGPYTISSMSFGSTGGYTLVRDQAELVELGTWEECEAVADMASDISVVRYVVTYVSQDGLRTLAHPQQGRHTYATAAEAETWLRAMAENNTASTLESVYGPNPRFQVRAVACYPTHFDPIYVYFH
jgi:hypothetical protein